MVSSASVLMDPEFKAILAEINARNLPMGELLEEKLAPLQLKISESPGQLMGAVTRNYKQSSFGIKPVNYLLETTLYAGIITPETRFVTERPSLLENPFSFAFISGIKNPCSLDVRCLTQTEEFRKNERGEFNLFSANIAHLLYFMERPPRVPQNGIGEGCFPSEAITTQTAKPRLEVYTGNEETIPFLQIDLAGWQYASLSKILGYDLPITEKIDKRIEQEQMEIYELVVRAEKEVKDLTRKRDARVELARETGGIIPHEFHTEMTNENIEKFRHNPAIRQARDHLETLVKTAIRRGYHENGKTVHRKLDAGVNQTLYLKEFFSHRKAELKL